MSDIEKVKKVTSQLSLLFVSAERHSVKERLELFEQLFKSVKCVENATDAIALLKHSPFDVLIVETAAEDDYALEMVKTVFSAVGRQKIIVLTGALAINNFLAAQHLGINAYLPITVSEKVLLQELYSASASRTKEKKEGRVKKQHSAALENQSNMVALFIKGKIGFANASFFHYFAVESLLEFYKKYHSLDSCFQKELGYLYSHDSESWEKKAGDGRSHFVKMADAEGVMHDFMLHLDKIEGSEASFVLTLSKVDKSELKHTYQHQLAKAEGKPHEHSNIRPVTYRNDTEVFYRALKKAHIERRELQIINAYKGISLTGKCTIKSFDKEQIVVQTSPSQLKAVAMTHQFVLYNEDENIFVYCDRGITCNHKQSTISAKHFATYDYERTQRRSLRVEPGKGSTLHIYVDGYEVMKETLLSVVDLSKEAVKIKTEELTKKVTKKRKNMEISLHLQDEEEKVNLKCTGCFNKMYDHDESYEVVFSLTLDPEDEATLVDYIARRQKRLIEEFKKLQVVRENDRLRK